MLRILFLLALFMPLILPVSAAAQVDPDRLDTITQEQEKAKSREAALAKEQEAIQQEIAKLKADLVTAAAEAGKYEKAGRATETRLTALSAEEEILKADLYADRTTLMRLLAALQSVEKNPPPALAIMPEDATEAARAARLMASLSNDLKAHAEKLSVRLTELSDLREDISAEREALATTEQTLEQRRLAVKKLVENRAALEKSISADRDVEIRRVAALAAEADSLRELITNFELATREVEPRVKPGADGEIGVSGAIPRVKPKSSMLSAELVLPPDTMRFADARGSLRSPVLGRVTESFGGGSQGITVTASNRAQVITPFNARVEFAGPFKNYENVVILNVGDGYFILLTGVGDIYTETGAIVNAGEPIGLMPSTTQQSANLYIEFRKNGAPINPTPWLGTAIAEAG